ncbi:4-demethylwyosine synthase TYW1 [Candidatus Bathyarchaeota archaeon]|nr:4-demethylwyosine synthase TYW1 [Candidatus Bathyarchaeota archaeon]
MKGSAEQTLPELLRRQKYQLVGNHSAVKKCRWLHKSLTEGRACYKSRFYGIESHRCLQMTPSVNWCTQRCLYCWRIQDGEAQPSSSGLKPSEWDDPSELVELSKAAQRRILSGYKGQAASGNVDLGHYREALEPKHAAISLTGEPTLYPYLDDLLGEFHRAGMTTFLVTNGTRPEVLKHLSEEPTQLYISVSAPSPERYMEICRPYSPDSWQRLMETIELLRSFSCPTAVRLTLVKGLNLQDHEGYARLILKAEPTYVEPKSYMYVGYSRRRLGFENMPTHLEVSEFSTRLARLTGYDVIDESTESRVVLLSRLGKPIRVT